MSEFSDELLRALAFANRGNEKLLSLNRQVYKGRRATSADVLVGG
jgi:hypothetical protein